MNLNPPSNVLWNIIVSSSPFQVEKLVLIDASVYAEGTGNLATLPRIAAYAGVSLSINLLVQTTNNFKLFLLSKFI